MPCDNDEPWFEKSGLTDGTAVAGLLVSVAGEGTEPTDSTADGGTEDSGGVVFESDTFDTLFDIDGADSDLGSSNDTCLVSTEAVRRFCSSSRFRSLPMASASSSCFSHFEYDFECRRRGDSAVETLKTAGPAETRLPNFDNIGSSKGLTLGLTFVTTEFLSNNLGLRTSRFGDCQSNCFPDAK